MEVEESEVSSSEEEEEKIGDSFYTLLSSIQHSSD